MKKLFLPFLLLLGVLTLLNGCSAGLEHVSIQVEVIKLERKTDGSLLATLKFGNPNVTSINVAKSTHQLTLNGKPAGVLEVNEPLGVPAQQVATVVVVLKGANGTADYSGQLNYRLSSLLTLRLYDTDTDHYKTSASGTVGVQ